LEEALGICALARAEQLLESLLDEKQLRSYRKTWGFDVLSGGRRYRLDLLSLQVRVYEGRRFIENWCTYLPNAPRADTLIAQLLLLRADPELLRKQAQVTLSSGEIIAPEREKRLLALIHGGAARGWMVARRAGYDVPDYPRSRSGAYE
jgi:hypothetical protein